MVGPDVRMNSAGVKGGEGQETRLFPLTWVRGPSGKLLPCSLLRRTSRWKGERIRPFPFLFALRAPRYRQAHVQRARVCCGRAFKPWNEGDPTVSQRQAYSGTDLGRLAASS